MDTFPLAPDPTATPVSTVANALLPAQETSGKEFSPALDKAIAQFNQKTQSAANNADVGNVIAIVTDGTKSENISTDSPPSAENILIAEFIGSLNVPLENTTPQIQGSAKDITPKNNNVTPIFISDVMELGTEDNKNIKAPAKAETLLLQQIQKILDEGKDKGTIIIKASTDRAEAPKENIPLLNSLSSAVLLTDASGNTTIQAKQNIKQVMMPEEHSKIIPGTMNTRSESIRQDVTEQFINAKLSGPEKEKNDMFQPHHDQKGNEGQSKNTFQQTVSANNNTTISPESGTGETSFSQQLGVHSGSTVVSHTTATSPVSVEGKFAPGANAPIAEQEIVDTIIQKFNVNPRLHTSKISMQLHPAELGSLKIDVVVKDGSISAHIVTQSHQVLETLDKNISRLREELQNQGFQVEDFKITLNTERGNEQQLFQEQFESKQQDFFARERTIPQETETFDTLLQEQEEFNGFSNKLYNVNLTA